LQRHRIRSKTSEKRLLNQHISRHARDLLGPIAQQGPTNIPDHRVTGTIEAQLAVLVAAVEGLRTFSCQRVAAQGAGHWQGRGSASHVCVWGCVRGLSLARSRVAALENGAATVQSTGA